MKYAYAVVLFNIFGLWLAPSTKAHAIEKKIATKQKNIENLFLDILYR